MTGRGWAILAAAVVCIGAGRVLGLEDVFLIGTGLVVMLAVAWVYVRVIRTHVAAARRLLPSRVHAGSSSRVELTLTNRGRRRSPVLTVRDPFDRGARSARFLVAPLAPGEVGRAAYRVPTDQRGVFDLGPLEVSVSDPFGLAAAVTPAAPLTRLTVYPRIDDIPPPPLGQGDDPMAGADHPRALSGGGSDFYALRPYVRGDDLRKVHWPSTAKAGDLMLRQDEMPWQARSTLVLDTRARTCPAPAFELLVSATASVAVAAARHGGLLRLSTTGGFDSRWEGGSASKIDNILEHLASVQLGDGSWLARLSAVRRAPGGGALVAFTTAMAPDEDLRALAALRTRFSSVTLVLVSAGAPRRVTGGVHVVEIRPERPFLAAWTQAMT